MRLLWDFIPFIIILLILVVIIVSPDWLNSLVSRRSDYSGPPPLPASVPKEQAEPAEETALPQRLSPADSTRLRRIDSILTARAINRAMRDAEK